MNKTRTVPRSHRVDAHVRFAVIREGKVVESMERKREKTVRPDNARVSRMFVSLRLELEPDRRTRRAASEALRAPVLAIPTRRHSRYCGTIHRNRWSKKR